MNDLTEELASLRKIVGEIIPHATDLMNENTGLKEWGDGQEQIIGELKQEITRLRVALVNISGGVYCAADRWVARVAHATLEGTGPQPVMEYHLGGKVVSRKEAEELVATVKWAGRFFDLDVPGSVDSAQGGWILQWDYKAVEVEG